MGRAIVYREVLRPLEGQDITLKISGSADVRGRVEKVSADTCILSQPSGDEQRTTIITDLVDIRGVVTDDWDYDVIAH
jgi:hypothetical protein